MSLALDGQAVAINAAGGASTVAASLTTTNTNDLIYVWVGSRASGVITISDGANLAWNARIPDFFNSGANSISGVSRAAHGISFWAKASGVTLTNDSITATTTVSGNLAIIAFGISNANTSSPFDSNVSIPLTMSGLALSGQTFAQSGTASTSNSNDFLIGLKFITHSGKETAASGWTPIISGQSNRGTIGAEFLIVSSPQTNLGFSWVPGGAPGASEGWVMAGDAVVQAAASTSFFQHSGPLRLERFNR